MICPKCATEQEFVDGRCGACGAVPTPDASSVRCSKCRGWVAKGEKFCGACGAKVLSRADRIRAVHRSQERQATLQGVNRGRRWMLIVAVLTLFGSAFSYLAGMGELDKQIKEAESGFVGMTPEERDAALRKESGMGWQELVEHNRGQVIFQTTVLAALGAIFLGLWWWAQTNAFAAALIALLLYITALLVGAVLDPASLLKGIIVKGVIVVALFSAVSAGYRQRSQQPRRSAA